MSAGPKMVALRRIMDAAGPFGVVTVAAVKQALAEEAAWCTDKAGAAERESAVQPDYGRICTCDGQASAYKAVASRISVT